MHFVHVRAEERARAHAADLSALESAVPIESHGGQEESTGYEVVIHHKEIRGVSSVFFERNSCYMYVDADEEVNTAEPYEVSPKSMLTGASVAVVSANV